MAGVNKVILVGNLGKDPEVRRLDNGKSRVSVSLATTEIYKNKAGERVSNTEWHNIIFWSPLADVAENYLRKGSKIYIEGKISSRSYEDKEGNMKYVSEIVVRDLVLLDSKGSNDNQLSQENKSEGEVFQSIGTENGSDDLPF